MKLLVTGREGQVAKSLAERAGGLNGIEIVTIGRPEVDLSKPATIYAAIAAARPDVVISAAAYTAVDRAEDERDLAFAINAVGAGHVAAAAAAAKAPIIHLSTDYVFDGTAGRPYSESDQTGPQGVYGASKLAGEHAVAAASPRHLILRTAWIYSPFGNNFVKTMLRLARDRDELRIVADQQGNPTSALDLADAILAAAPTLLSGESATGIYHLAGTGGATWCDFATEVFEVSSSLGGPYAVALPIRTDEYPTKARRPANSRLDSSRFTADFFYRMPNWRESVRAVVERLVAGY